MWLFIIEQGDEDLVSEFVANEGLGCLLDVGQKCDQTCQQYVLKGEHHAPGWHTIDI